MPDLFDSLLYWLGPTGCGILYVAFVVGVAFIAGKKTK